MSGGGDAMNRSELERQIEVIEQTMADVQKDLIRRSVGLSKNALDEIYASAETQIRSLKAKRSNLRRKLR